MNCVKPKFPQVFSYPSQKLITEYNYFTNKVSIPIYEMLNRNIIPKEEAIPREKIMEMNKIFASISTSLRI